MGDLGLTKNAGRNSSAPLHQLGENWLAQSSRCSLPLIKFLVSFGTNPPEEVCSWGDLAQAALEAQSLLAEDPTND
jgi:hypothetical protein